MTSNALTLRQAALAAVDQAAVDAFADFIRLEVGDGDASAQTARTYLANVGDFYVWCQANGVRASAATEADLKNYRRELVERGTPRSTQSARLAAVRRFFAAAVWRGLRADNPAAGLRAKKDRTAEEEKIHYLKQADYMTRLLSVVDGDDVRAVRDRAILALFSLQGLRVAEAAALDVSDVDLVANEVRIRSGKGGKKRTLILATTDRAALADWLAVRDQVAVEDEAALFVAVARNQTDAPGRRMTDRSLRRRVDRYLTLAGLKKEGFSCHSLRHSAATWSAFAGASVEQIAKQLGHSSLTTTTKYVDAAERLKKNPAAILEAFFSQREASV